MKRRGGGWCGRGVGVTHWEGGRLRKRHCYGKIYPVGKFGSVGCVAFLVEGTGVCVLVDEAGSCLSGGQDHVLWCVLGCL